MRTIFFLLLAFQMSAQNLPVRSATIFKNGKTMIECVGKVPLKDGKYSTRDLPPALFGAFWVGAPSGNLNTVFTCMDSVWSPAARITDADVLIKNKGKLVTLSLYQGNAGQLETVEGYFEKVYKAPEGKDDLLIFRSKAGRYLTLSPYTIRRVEFNESPDLNITTKEESMRMDLSFKGGKSEEEISMMYLSDEIGWTPVYRLELGRGSQKTSLSLRAEIANNSTDLGNAELRLAVGMPNFAFAAQKNLLFDFDNFMLTIQTQRNPAYSYDNRMMMSNVAYQAAYTPDAFDNLTPTPFEGDGSTDSKVEDYYFYTVKPGNFPKNSRFQVPLLDAVVEPLHFFECILPTPDVKTYFSAEYYNNLPKQPLTVTHYAEFVNKSKQPWTTGVVNMLALNADGQLQPLSQDMLPYTPPGGTCKVRIAETPELKVTQFDAVIDRKENVKNFHSREYDLVKIEGEATVVNFKNETVRIKVRRTVSGHMISSGQQWELKQENASFGVNDQNEVLWDLELKPGESKSWKYQYEVYTIF